MANKEIEALQEHIDERLNEIEKLINLSLLTSVIGQIDEICHCVDKDKQCIEEIKEILAENNFKLEKEEKYGDATVVYIKSLEQMSMAKARIILGLLQDIGQELIPVFQFERIYGNQRKKMLEEHISFYVLNKELHIFG